MRKTFARIHAARAEGHEGITGPRLSPLCGVAAIGAAVIRTVVTPGVAAPAATVGKLIMSPGPIAATGSQKAKGAVAVTVTAETSGGVPVGGATVYLSFTPTTRGGSATAHKLALCGTPTAIKTDRAGTLKVTYRAPAHPLPKSGTDILTAATAASAAIRPTTPIRLRR